VLTTGVGLSRRKIIDGEFTVVSTRRQRPSIGFLSCLLIVGVAIAVLIRFAWAPLLMAFILIGSRHRARWRG
jgi:hypothetical protein